MLKGVIFDMDGLMFDTERVWSRLWAPALRRFGRDTVPDGLDEAARGTAGERLQEVIRRYCGPDIDPEALRLTLLELGAAEFAESVPKKPGLDGLLAYLRGRGLPLAVASSSPEATVRRNLKISGTSEYFSVVIGGDRITRSKPDPDIFLAAAAALGTAPADTLVLEDSYNGIRAAAAGGFIPVMVPDLMPANDEMRGLYRACFPSLAAVRQAFEAGTLL